MSVKSGLAEYRKPSQVSVLTDTQHAHMRRKLLSHKLLFTWVFFWLDWLFGQTRRWVNLYHRLRRHYYDHHRQQDDNYPRDCVLFAVAFTYASRFCEFCINQKPTNSVAQSLFSQYLKFSSQAVSRRPIVCQAQRANFDAHTPKPGISWCHFLQRPLTSMYSSTYPLSIIWRVMWAATRADLVKFIKLKCQEIIWPVKNQ